MGIIYCSSMYLIVYESHYHVYGARTRGLPFFEYVHTFLEEFWETAFPNSAELGKGNVKCKKLWCIRNLDVEIYHNIQ